MTPRMRRYKAYWFDTGLTIKFSTVSGYAGACAHHYANQMPDLVVELLP